MGSGETEATSFPTSYIIILVIILIVILLILEIIRENITFRVTRYQLSSAKLAGLKGDIKIVFLSDLHDRKFGKKNAKLLDAIYDEKPDLILVGGDMVVAKFRTKYKNGSAFMRVLPQIAPVYFIYGNHEQRMKEEGSKYGPIRPFENILKRAGVKILTNENELIFIKGKSIRLTGLELPYRTKKNRLSRKDINALIGSVDERNFHLLLAHDPVHFPVYKSWGADLVLAGHLHGGLVRIPGWRGMVSPHGQLFPRYSGEMTTVGKSTIIVSKGLGSHTLPLRLFNPAEIVSISLTGRMR